MTAEHIKEVGKFVGPLAEIFSRLHNGGISSDELAAGLQAILEKTPLGQSSMDKIKTCEKVDLTSDFLSQTMCYDGQAMIRHPRGGGWVPAEQDQYEKDMPYVAESAYVGPFAMVSGGARLFDNVQLFDKAHATGNAILRNNVRMHGSSLIADDAVAVDDVMLSGSAMIFDEAIASGCSRLEENAALFGKAMIFNARLSDNCAVGGDSHIRTDSWIYGYVRISGNTVIMDGAYLGGDEELSSGCYTRKEYPQHNDKK